MIIGSTFPMLSLWIDECWGDKAKIGQLFGTIALVSILSQQMWGYLGDMVWSRRRILLFNLPLAMAGLVAAAVTRHWPLFLGLWVVIAFFMNPVNPFLNAIVMGSREGRGRYPQIRAWGTIGFLIACLSSGWLADRFSTAWVAFPLAVGAGFCTWLWLWRVDTPHRPPQRRVSFAQVQRYFLSQPHFLWFLAALIINRAAHGPAVIFQAFLAKGMGGEGETHLAAVSLYVIGALAELPVLFFGGALLARFGELRCLMWSTGIGVLRFILTPLMGLSGLMAIQIFHGFTFGLFYLAGVSWIDRHTPGEIKTSAQTIFTMVFFGLASLIGTPLGGWLYERFGQEHATGLFWGAAAVIALSLMAFVGVVRSEPEGPPADVLPLPGETPAGQ